MALAVRKCASISAEGLTDLADLVEFYKASLKQISENLCRPRGRVPDPDQRISAHASIPTPSFVFGTKSQLCLKAAIDSARYYETTGRDMTVGNIIWNQTIKNFVDHWKSLTDRKYSTDPEVPKISKSLPIMKWNKAFSDFTRRVIGARTIPLFYVIRDDAVTPTAALNLNVQPAWS